MVSKARTEVIGNCTLHLGDAREVLAGLQVDVVLTDPVWPNCPEDLLEGGKDPQALWDATMAAMPDVRRLVTVMRCDSDPRFLASVPRRLPFFRSIQMPYVMPHYTGRILNGDELAYWFGTPVASAPGRRVVPGRAPGSQPGNRAANGHPCSRSTVHFDWLVHWCSDPDETVCDPFMGSGTTGASCVRVGRPFVGVEIVPAFFDLACRQIEKAVREPDLFRRRQAEPQEAML